MHRTAIPRLFSGSLLLLRLANERTNLYKRDLLKARQLSTTAVVQLISLGRRLHNL